MGAQGPIGIFDSGFGGLTVFRGIRELLPEFDYLYLGDNARSPYGNRSFDVVLDFTTDGVRYLFDRGCPLVIIACNTASAKALRSIQQGWLPHHHPSRRVLGVIRPTVEAIDPLPGIRAVALWATRGTVQSGSFLLEIAKHAPRVELVQQACPLLVPLVEAGELEGEGLDYFVRKYWAETTARSDRIDALLLGCTHYPLLRETIRRHVPERVQLLSQDQIVPPSLQDYLHRHPEMEARLSRGAGCQYLTTDQCDHFDRLAEIFMGQPIASDKVELS